MSDPFPHDGTRLGKELQELEESNPTIKEARRRLEETFDRLRMSPEDRVNPANLQVDPPDQN